MLGGVNRRMEALLKNKIAKLSCILGFLDLGTWCVVHKSTRIERGYLDFDEVAAQSLGRMVLASGPLQCRLGRQVSGAVRVEHSGQWEKNLGVACSCHLVRAA